MADNVTYNGADMMMVTYEIGMMSHCIMPTALALARLRIIMIFDKGLLLKLWIFTFNSFHE